MRVSVGPEEQHAVHSTKRMRQPARSAVGRPGGPRMRARQASNGEEGLKIEKNKGKAQYAKA